VEGEGDVPREFGEGAAEREGIAPAQRLRTHTQRPPTRLQRMPFCAVCACDFVPCACHFVCNNACPSALLHRPADTRTVLTRRFGEGGHSQLTHLVKTNPNVVQQMHTLKRQQKKKIDSPHFLELPTQFIQSPETVRDSKTEAQMRTVF